MADHVWQAVPAPTQDRPGHFVPNWNEVALFFNLTAASRPGDYAETTAADAHEWLDEGASPASPTSGDFVCNYWARLSYGKFGFGLNTPRDATGVPLVPTVDAPNGHADDYPGLMRACVDANAEAVWRAAGSIMDGVVRSIPSIVLIHHYSGNAWASGGWTQTVGGVDYSIGRITHFEYDLSLTHDTNLGIQNSARAFLPTLCHENGHNFLDFGDLYGPQGCTGYWDLLGDNLISGAMSEVSAVHKARIGWLQYSTTIEGITYPPRFVALRPFTETGDAAKIVPDPVNNPAEYFVLEYRKATGPEVWQPDGGLSEEGLLITHINDRLGVAGTWLLREAPYYHPEMADFTDHGGPLWTGLDHRNGFVYPRPGRDSFTSTSQPSSNFYGRKSGLSITGIQLHNDVVTCLISVTQRSEVGWTVGDQDHCVAGRFTPESTTAGHELYCRNADSAALLIHREANWFVKKRHDGRIGDWALGRNDRAAAADLDGDGFDELFVRSDNWAGVLKWRSGSWSSITVQGTRIGAWALGGGDREVLADLDGDGKAEIYLRSAEWAGVARLNGGQLVLSEIHNPRIGEWRLGPDDREWVGRFSQSSRDEIVVRSPSWLGLIAFDSATQQLSLRSIQHDNVDNWALHADDAISVGDFDGDGLDEIYIRSSNAAAIMKFNDGRFQTVWKRTGDIAHQLPDGQPATIALEAADRSYAGRFLPDRDGILHRRGDAIAVLTWEADEMKIRQYLTSWFDSRWNLGADDKFVLGDFQRVGRDIGDPTLDFIADHLTDVFIHNSWGTAMVGVNHIDTEQEIGLTWVNQGTILFQDTSTDYGIGRYRGRKFHHRIDIEWILATWHAIHGGDPSPIAKLLANPPAELKHALDLAAEAFKVVDTVVHQQTR